MFPLYDSSGALRNTPESGRRMLGLDTTVVLVQLVGLAFVFIIPKQKRELQHLMSSGKTSLRTRYLTASVYVGSPCGIVGGVICNISCQYQGVFACVHRPTNTVVRSWL
jgi:hypothetical protein